MVVYNLACDNAHVFEGWFDSAQAFTHQVESSTVSCPVCGSNGVTRQPTAPNIVKQRDGAAMPNADAERFEAIRALQEKITDFVVRNTEDVGREFPDEARRIHRQEAPERAIRGQATRKEAEALREEGIEVTPLPFASIPRDQLH